MAGSYSHMTNDKGKFRGTEFIENLGDAYEALEECYGMIWQLAARLDEEHDGEHGGFPRADAERLKDIARYVEEARENYVAGLQESPGRTRYAKNQGAGMPQGQWGEGDR